MPLLLAMTGWLMTVAETGDAPADAVRRWAGLLGVLAGLGVVVVFGAALWVALRRGRAARTAARKAAEARRREAGEPRVDAWEEAGRRVEVDEDER